MNKHPDLIYLIDDVSIYSRRNHIAAQKMCLTEKIAKMFIASKVVILDYYKLCRKVNELLIAKRTKFDLVIVIGEKGNLFFEQIKKDVCYEKLIQIDIKRMFNKKLSDGFECEYKLINKQNISLESHRNILIVDDIIYTGGTIRTLLQEYEINLDRCIFASLVKFKDFNEITEFCCGYDIEKLTWPQNEVELWCLWDLIEENAFSTNGTSLIDDEFFCKQQMFGDNYETVKSMINRLKSWHDLEMLDEKE